MIKSVIMPGNKQAIVVYRLPDGRVYCSDASSTAFEFPLSNAKIITDGACLRYDIHVDCIDLPGNIWFFKCNFAITDGSPKIEVPLDGTVYDMETGKVGKSAGKSSCWTWPTVNLQVNGLEA